MAVPLATLERFVSALFRPLELCSLPPFPDLMKRFLHRTWQLISVLDERVSRIVTSILGDQKLCSLLVEDQDQKKMYPRRIPQDRRHQLPEDTVVGTISVGDVNLDLFRQSQGPHQRLLFDKLPHGTRGSSLYRLSGDHARSWSRGASTSSTSGPPSLSSGQTFPEALADHGASFLINSILYADTLSEEQKSTVAAVRSVVTFSLHSPPVVTTHIFLQVVAWHLRDILLFETTAEMDAFQCLHGIPCT